MSSTIAAISCLVLVAVAFAMFLKSKANSENKKSKKHHVLQQPHPTRDIQFESYYKDDDDECEIIDDIYIPSMIKDNKLFKNNKYL